MKKYLGLGTIHQFIMLMAAVVPFSTFAGPQMLTCDAADEIGRNGTLAADLSNKTISFTVSGQTEMIYDSATLCGWSPSAGTSDVTCPFSSQTGDNGYLAISLQCNRPSELLTTGDLFVLKGKGTLRCSVHSSTGFYLKLSKCQEN